VDWGLNSENGQAAFASCDFFCNSISSNIAFNTAWMILNCSYKSKALLQLNSIKHNPTCQVLHLSRSSFANSTKKALFTSTQRL
jgi:hypothetical protein